MIFSWPAIVKEVRMRMRGKSIFIIENLYLLFLGAVTILVLSLGSFKGAGWEVGRQLFSSLATIQILILVFISPTITASAITLERDQKTYDILRCTPLLPSAILGAKLLACLSTFFILALVSVPMIAVTFVLGGVSPLQTIWTYFVTLVSMLLAGLLGLYLSTVFRRTLAAIPVSGVVVIVFLIGTGVLSQFAPFLGTINPLTSFSLIKGDWVIKYFSIEISFWVPYVLLSLVFCLWLYLKSIQNLKPVKKRNFIPSRIVLALAVSLIFIGIFSHANLIQREEQLIRETLCSYIISFFLIVVFIAGFISSGYVTFNDYWLSRENRWGRFLSWRGWFGGSNASGTKFTFLITVSAFLILAIGTAPAPQISGKMSSMLLSFFPALLFSVSISLAARAISLKKKIRGRFLPRIITGILLFVILYLPVALVNYAHRDEVTPSALPVDILLFLNPISSFQATFTPDDFFTAHPFLKKILFGLPFSVITSLIYLTVVFILSLVSGQQLNSLRQEEFTLRPGTESL